MVRDKQVGWFIVTQRVYRSLVTGKYVGKKHPDAKSLVFPEGKVLPMREAIELGLVDLPALDNGEVDEVPIILEHPAAEFIVDISKNAGGKRTERKTQTVKVKEETDGNVSPVVANKKAIRNSLE